ncbi:hypothetical protein BJV78DRAFT_889469 [Lactifluus subvellereus]|nr:hypothetical protein BJV78DRAFT_889469 [Lactifluus subvellereus]
MSLHEVLKFSKCPGIPTPSLHKTPISKTADLPNSNLSGRQSVSYPSSAHDRQAQYDPDIGGSLPRPASLRFAGALLAPDTSELRGAVCSLRQHPPRLFPGGRPLACYSTCSALSPFRPRPCATDCSSLPIPLPPRESRSPQCFTIPGILISPYNCLLYYQCPNPFDRCS